jgi:glycosyltransferase involved in cell wall biosynthesis
MSDQKNSGLCPLSVIVITRNEEKNIVDCLNSVNWADEIVVVDSGSTDKTVELAKQVTSQVFVTEWKGYSDSKNVALSKTKHEWVLWLDADERVMPELAKEIQEIVRAGDSGVSGYEVARRAYFLGKWIKHCGWYPGYVLRLFKKKGVKFNDAQVHERLEFAGTTGRLKHDLLHYTDNNLFHYYSKFNNYTSLAADDLAKAGRKYSVYDLLVRPPYLFLKMYILRLGFLDGMHGLILSVLSSAYVFTKYAKVWEKQLRESGQ